MNQHNAAHILAARLIDAVLRALATDDDADTESDLLKHFPFARPDERASSHARLRIPTTAHGSL